MDAEGARELASRVRLFDDGKGEPQPHAAVERAIVEKRVLRIGYVDKDDEVTERTVEPTAVLGVKLHWYLWGYCRLREAPRAFRLDRIRSARLLEETATDRGLDPRNFELPDLIGRGILGD